ncbi:MAG: hypothetical protein EBS19_05145, partial [Spirochaetia bacterium]|nr:hypothetical protein [Spirochaetia bacterium]
MRTIGFIFTEESKRKISEIGEKKSVLLLNESGEILREFTSIRSASDYIGTNISRVLVVMVKQLIDLFVGIKIIINNVN